jgi:hypothetical protein
MNPGDIDEIYQVAAEFAYMVDRRIQDGRDKDLFVHKLRECIEIARRAIEREKIS